jgi:hypothetical protein
MKSFYLSFADVTLPRGHQWLGACLVKAENEEEAIQTAWKADCNPGGEVLIVSPDRDPAEKWFNRLLMREDLLEMGAEIVATYDLPSEANALVNTTGEIIQRPS